MAIARHLRKYFVSIASPGLTIDSQNAKSKNGFKQNIQSQLCVKPQCQYAVKIVIDKFALKFDESM